MITSNEPTPVDLDEWTEASPTETIPEGVPVTTPHGDVANQHLKGLLESLVFVSDGPIKASELAKTASALTKDVQALLLELKAEYAHRGIVLDEVAGGWLFRTNAAFSPFVRDLTKQKPVKMSRAQLETLAILAYRQPITRPEIDEIRGVDSGATLKMLLERDLVRILGKKDEPGRPLLYGTTSQFLEFFGLKSLKDMPTLKEFTELNEDSLRVVERELGDVAEAESFASESSATDPAPPPVDAEGVHDNEHGALEVGDLVNSIDHMAPIDPSPS
jgi:segregation and condensation protein B